MANGYPDPIPLTGFTRQFFGSGAKNLYRYLEMLDKVIPGDVVPDITEEDWQRRIGKPKGAGGVVGSIGGILASELPMFAMGAGATRMALGGAAKLATARGATKVGSQIARLANAGRVTPAMKAGVVPRPSLARRVASDVTLASPYNLLQAADPEYSLTSLVSDKPEEVPYWKRAALEVGLDVPLSGATNLIGDAIRRGGKAAGIPDRMASLAEAMVPSRRADERLTGAIADDLVGQFETGARPHSAAGLARAEEGFGMPARPGVSGLTGREAAQTGLGAGFGGAAGYGLPFNEQGEAPTDADRRMAALGGAMLGAGVGASPAIRRAMPDRAGHVVGPGVGDTPVKQDTSIMSLLSGDEVLDLPEGRRATIRDVGHALEQRAVQRWGRPLDIKNPADQQKVAQVLADEAEFASKDVSGAVEWYRQRLEMAYDVAATRHPEILDDDISREMFRIALATTSNGIEVQDNAKYADEIYAHWKQHGEFPINKGWGKAAIAMKNTFALVNDITRRIGPEQFLKLLDDDSLELSVSQLKQMGFKISGEAADQILPPSVMMGPKVGGGFYRNLGGFFDEVTMDRWFRRTIGRVSGDMLEKPSDKAIAKGSKRFTDAMEAEGTTIDPNDRDAVLEAATERFSMWEKMRRDAEKVEKGSANKLKKPEWAAAAERIKMNLDPTIRDAPTQAERRVLRSIVSDVQRILKERTGKDYDAAQIQAMVWYPEKRLYRDTFGIRGPEDDIDYATALGRLYGMDDNEIEGFAEYAADRISGLGDRRYAGTEGTSLRGGLRRAGGKPPSRAIPKQLISDQARADIERSRTLPEGERSSPIRRGSEKVREVVVDGETHGNVPVTEIKLSAPYRTRLPAMGTEGVDGLQEIRGTAEGAAAFHAAIHGAKKADPMGSASVDAYATPKDYEGMTFVTLPDMSAGLAIKPDGEIVSLYSREVAGVEGVSTPLLLAAAERGGTYMDAFDTYLSDIYAAAGFRPVARNKFNPDPSIAPKGWDRKFFSKYNGGEPDVVSWVYNPNQAIKLERDQLGRTIGGEYVDTYDEMWEAGRQAGQKLEKFVDRPAMPSAAHMRKEARLGKELPRPKPKKKKPKPKDESKAGYTLFDVVSPLTGAAVGGAVGGAAAGPDATPGERAAAVATGALAGAGAGVGLVKLVDRVEMNRTAAELANQEGVSPQARAAGRVAAAQAADLIRRDGIDAVKTSDAQGSMALLSDAEIEEIEGLVAATYTRDPGKKTAEVKRDRSRKFRQAVLDESASQIDLAAATGDPSDMKNALSALRGAESGGFEQARLALRDFYKRHGEDAATKGSRLASVQRLLDLAQQGIAKTTMTTDQLLKEEKLLMAQAGVMDAADDLRRMYRDDLRSLLDEGVISQAEYDAMVRGGVSEAQIEAAFRRGEITEAQKASYLAGETSSYVPLMRDLTTREFSQLLGQGAGRENLNSNALRRMSQEDVLNPDADIIAPDIAYIKYRQGTNNMIRRQHASQALVAAFDADPKTAGEFMRELRHMGKAGWEEAPNSIVIRTDGTDRAFSITDPDLWLSLTSLGNQFAERGKVMGFMRHMKDVLRVGITGSPLFGVANVVRDTMVRNLQATGKEFERNLLSGGVGAALGGSVEAALAEDGADPMDVLGGVLVGFGLGYNAPGFKASLTGAFDMLRYEVGAKLGKEIPEEEWAQSIKTWMIEGGYGAGWLPQGMTDVADMTKLMMEGGEGRVRDMLLPNLDLVNPLGPKSRRIGKVWQDRGIEGVYDEVVPWAAIFNRALENGTRIAEFRSSMVRTGGDVPTSVRASRDISLDFRRMGGADFVKGLNSVSAFLNAKLQGYRKLGEMTSEAAKSPAKAASLAVGIGGISAGGIGLTLLNQEDDEYWDVPLYERNNYALIKKPGGGFFRVPKPFEFALPGTMAERFADWLYAREQGWPEQRRAVFDRTLPQVLGQYGGELPMPTAIEPMIEVLANYDFYRKRAIDPVYDAFTKVEPESQYDARTNIIAKELGQLANWKYLSPARIDHIMRAVTGSMGSAALDKLTPKSPMSKPAVGGRFVTSPASRSDIEQAFMSRMEDGERAWNTYERYLEEGNREDAARIMDRKGDLMQYYQRYGKLDRDVLTKLRRQRRTLMQDRRTGDIQSRQDRINRINQTISRIVGRLD